MDIDEMEMSEGITTEAPASEAPATGPTQDNKKADLAGAAQRQPHGNPRAVDGDDDASDAGSALSTEAWASGFFEGDLRDALDGVQTQGSFASFHPLRRVDPDLFVHDVGPIVLPLQEPQIRQVIDKAIQAPFGKGSQTIVDTSVRNTWELDPKHFELRGPRWGTDLQRICAIVAADMGIRSPVGAELYKLLVYEKGAMFKAHTDSEKCPGMFGTLVICLPSPHEGGDVVVKHAGQTKTFKTSKFEQSFACWYSDVQHEVLPVTDGYRVVLTYNLKTDQAAERPSAGLWRCETRMLRHTLKRWLRYGTESEAPNYVYYGLDHEYTEANVSLKALKGRDLAVVQTLQELSSELEFDVLLALTEMMEQGSTDHHGYDPRYDTGKPPSRRQRELDEMAPHELNDVFDTRLTVKVLMDLSGRPITRDFPLELDSCLQDDSFFEEVSRKEEFEGFTGNSGATATHWYCVTAALIIRRDRIHQFLAESVDMESWRCDETIKLLLPYLADLILKDAPNKESAFSTLKDVWTRSSALARRARPDTDVNIVSKTLQAAVQMEQWELFESVAGKSCGSLPSGYYKWLREQINEGKMPFDKVKTGLTSSVLACEFFFEKYKAIEFFAPTDQPLTEDIRQWVRETLVRGLAASVESASLTLHDARPIVESAKVYADFDWLISVVVPLIEDQFIVPAFTLEFLGALFMNAKEFPVNEALELYKRVAKDFVVKLDFSKIHGAKTVEQTSKAPRYSYGQTAQEAAIAAHNNLAVTPVGLLSLFFSLIKLSRPPHEDLALPLAMKLVSFAPKMQPSDFEPLWIPFLQKLMTVLEKTKTPLTTPRYQQIFGAVLESYRDNYIGQKPGIQASRFYNGMPILARSHCLCLDCQKLNMFLEKPGEYVCRFRVSKKARYHLHQEIERNGIQCSHQTDRNGSTETLVVTKLRELEERRYAERQKRAAERFQEFDQTKLGLLLGEDYPTIAQGLWERPVNLASERGGATFTPAAGPSQPGTVPGLRPTAAMPAVSPPTNVPVPGSFNAFITRPGGAPSGVVASANTSGPTQPLPSRGTPTLATGAPAPRSQPTPAPPRVVKRKAESEIIDLT
ncbi:2OG-Fe(II) oxygenase superfamily protein [Colletotrichum zoysiae]|uniref:2OG-Fe(II) oxygenase superfamily protein n=1 Tax=Colletotrichum zoysiae TaxID=1216348 RepID=A0AAD9H2T7_9PEZI|nr:2OG-Fe(II) oxygenase superfamily protein [Colletotrichum zoysiae]